jgi:homoaconitate hydratase family protein
LSISDQIFAAHSKRKKITVGEIANFEIDLVMVHEQLGGRIAPEYEKLGKSTVWDPNKIAFILDHWVPPPDVSAAKMHQRARQFAHKYGFIHNLGQNLGICHQVLPEKGFTQPGTLVVGSDSHTSTYGAFNCLGIGVGATDIVMVFDRGKLWFKVPETVRFNLTGQLSEFAMTKDVALWFLKQYRTHGFIYQALEFGGDALKNLSIDGRMTLSNMAVEMGAKCATFEYDNMLEQWLNMHPTHLPHLKSLAKPIFPSSNVEYKSEMNIDISDIPPMVAKPYSPDEVIPVAELGHIPIDQAFLGSCTNGRIEDLRVAARLVKGHTISSQVRFIIIPASKEVYLQALREGLIEIFVSAGGVVEYPSCGPCIGGHMGVLGPNEVCVSSSNRNFRGRMGDPSSKTYLASPAVVAASAINGVISIPSKGIWESK